MPHSTLPAGGMLPLVRRLAATPDPLALFGGLTDDGRRPDTLLLESADTTTGQGERSILIPRAAARLTCRGREVRVAPLTPNGVALAQWLSRAAGDAAQVDWDAESGELIFRYPPRPGGDLHDAARIRSLSPLDALRRIACAPLLVARPATLTHLVAGVFSYDLVDLFENLPPAAADPLGYPDYVFWVPEQLIVVDHVQGGAIILTLVAGGPDSEARYHDAVRSVETLTQAVTDAPRVVARPKAASDQPSEPPGEPDLSDEAYADMVRRLQVHIVQGDVFQIVPSRTFRVPCPDAFAAYRELRELNPSPYMFYIGAADHVLFGASPETALRVTGGPSEMFIRPIAGTAPRGRDAHGAYDADYDGRLEAALRTDGKELAEHMMLVDLARNDVARVCRAGSRRVTKLLTVERYSHVMHLVSEVSGELAADLDALHAYTGSLNMGTLVGAPKIRAAELLRQMEPTRRGPYGGAVGYLTHDGEMDTAIVIRAAVVKDGEAYVRAGAGIVFASDPGREARETRHKAASVLRAIARAGVGRGAP